MKKEDCFCLGFIQKVHALKGEVGVVLDTDNANHYKKLEIAFLLQKGQLVPFIIQKIQILPNQKAIIKFEGFENPTDAQKLVGIEIYLPLSILPQTQESEFYLHEVIDFMVIDKEKGEIGRVTNLYEGVQQDLLGIDYQENEVLIPWVDAIVKKVNKQNKTIEVEMPNGLLELNF
jgi:16S rRNA processing protein RimM